MEMKSDETEAGRKGRKRRESEQNEVSGRRIAGLALLGAIVGGLWTYSRREVRHYESLDLSEVEKPGRTLSIDGVGIHYLEAGTGPALLLIHGLGASTFAFRRILPDLARHFRVVALDLKGFGFSERADGDYSLGGQAALVRQVMDRLGIERASVLGHSMGGAVAMRLALAYPERVERLILASSASDLELGRRIWGAGVIGRLLPLVAPFTLHNRRFRELSLKSGYCDPSRCTEDVIEGYMLPGRVRGYLRALGNTMAHWRRDPPLHPADITQSTLVLWGEGDRWLPPSRGERLHRLIPGSRLELVAGGGHMFLEEQPEAALRIIEDFLLEREPVSR
jgi:pimeloyl-ACP methyl ester carboxylesterase